MARWGKHAERIDDELVLQGWEVIRRCDKNQALLLRNLAAGQVAAFEGFTDEIRPGDYTDAQLVLGILEADLNKRTAEKGERLRSVQDYITHKPDWAASYATLRRAFGSWDEARCQARLLAVRSPNRHLMIREGVSQTGAPRKELDAHTCVLALADCIDDNFGLRPSREQYFGFTLNSTRHYPSANTIAKKLGGWDTACDAAVVEIRRHPERYPKSGRLYAVLAELDRFESEAEKAA